MGLTVAAIRRPIFICMFVAALIFFGLIGESQMGKELIPNIDIPYVVVTVTYNGAGPNEIETQVNQILEEQLAGVENLKTLTSDAIEGQGTVMCEFYLGTNTNDAAANVRDKVSVAKKKLPQDIDEPVVQKINSSSFPIMTIALDGTLPDKELRRIADKQVKDELATVSGVSQVDINGGFERQLQIQVDAKRLNAYGLSMNDIANAISLATLNTPGGTLRVDKFSYSVRTKGEFVDAEDIKNVKINAGNNKSFYLKDLATIYDGVKERSKFTRLNGKEAVLLSIVKATGGNVVEIAEKTVEKMNELNDEILPPGVELSIVNDDSEFVKESIFEVNKTLGEAIVIVVVIVLLFLHTMRGTFIVSIAIPTSLFATYGPISAMNFTLNTFSLLALALVIGILVDDSIVVLENIERHLKKGESVVDAAVNGRSEIGFAAMAISLVDISVFLPIAFMEGMVGQIFRQFGITIAIAVAFSLLMSFTLTPMLASKWLKEEKESKKDLALLKEKVLAGKGNVWDKINYSFSEFMSIFESGIVAITNIYRGVVTWTLSNKFTTILIGTMLLFIVACLPSGFFSGIRIALIVITAICVFIAIKKQPDKFTPIIFGIVAVAILLTVKYPLQITFFPDVDEKEIDMTFRLPEGTSLQETERVMKQFENVILAKDYMKKADKEYKEFLIYNPISWFQTHKVKVDPKLVTVVGSTTVRSMGGNSGDNYAGMNMYVWDKKFRPGKSLKDICIELYGDLAKIPGPVSVTIKQKPVTGGANDGDGVCYKVQGSVEMEVLDKVAKDIAAKMSKVRGVTDIDLSYKPGLPEKQLYVDRAKAADANLSIVEIGKNVRAAVTGNTDTKFRESGSEYDINIRYQREYRNDSGQVPDIIISNKNGKPIYAKDIAEIKEGIAPNKIEREKRLRKITVNSNVMKGYSIGNLQTECDKLIADVKMPVGVRVSTTGASKDMEENFGYMFGSLTIALVLVYFLMCALFESLLTPLVIYFTIPQAMVGALLALYITGEKLSMISMIGMIMLIGLVTKNAILMCDYTNTCRSRGLNKHEALINAGCARLRPIMMTTIAMIGGMFPMAIGNSAGSELRCGMAIAVIGGLCVSMFLTLLVIPVMYDIVDAAWKWTLTLPFLKGLKKADDEKEDEWSANRSEDFDPTDIA